LVDHARVECALELFEAGGWLFFHCACKFPSQLPWGTMT
jgi:hypothetical protein